MEAKPVSRLVVDARSVSTPLVGIETFDPSETIREVTKAVFEVEPNIPVFRWDLISGLKAVNELAVSALRQVFGGDLENLQAMTSNPAESLNLMVKFPGDSLIFFLNAHRYLEPTQQGSEAVSQGIWNLRDLFKSNGSTLVLLGPSFMFPPELAQDIIVFSEELPDDSRLMDIAAKVCEAAGIGDIEEDDALKIASALRGLPAFPAEQVVAMSIENDRVNLPSVWKRKKSSIEKTRGLTFWEPQFTFKDVGGSEEIKAFDAALFSSAQSPNCIVFIDEIEKLFAGAFGSGSDTSGVSQDQLGVMLSTMEDNQICGKILVGPPGTGKSQFAQAVGKTFNVPVIKMDLGAVKGSLVGQSEAQMRAMMKTVLAVGGNKAYFFATCNKLEAMPPELRRRFLDGIWYFDIPNPQEQASIWKICMSKYGLKAQDLPEYSNWTGAEIRNCCFLAYRLGKRLTEVSRYIVPIMISDPQSVEKLRNTADGRYLSASYAGPYQKDKSVMPEYEEAVRRMRKRSSK
jgi:hypothetical protein